MLMFFERFEADIINKIVVFGFVYNVLIIRINLKKYVIFVEIIF